MFLVRNFSRSKIHIHLISDNSCTRSQILTGRARIHQRWSITKNYSLNTTKPHRSIHKLQLRTHVHLSEEQLAGSLIDHPSFHLAHQFRLNPQRSLGQLAKEFLKKRSVAEQKPSQHPLRSAALVMHEADPL